MRRIGIVRGLWQMDVNLASLAGYGEYDAPFIVLVQLYDENGRAASGAYEGPATVVERGGEKYLVLGDPMKSTQLPEYRIGKALEESDRELEEAVAGFKAGMKLKGRKSPTKSHIWHEAFGEARKLLGGGR